MSTFVTGDLHFFHANIIRYCHRPFISYQQMNAVLMSNWNATVMPSDVVYVLGDFAFLPAEHQADGMKVFKSLNGKKYLVKGNHDKGLVLELEWEDVYYPLGIEVDGVKLTHEGGQYMRMKPDMKDVPVFCSHVHDIWKMRGNLLNCGVDVWHFFPVEFGTAKAYWKYRFDFWKSHGGIADDPAD